MITVVHIKQHPDAVYCGRACYGLKGSPLANTYVIGRDGTREEVIDAYRHWFETVVLTGRVVVGSPALSRGWIEFCRLVDLAHAGDLKLGCWCRRDGTDVACHCDVIKEHIEAALAEA